MPPVNPRVCFECKNVIVTGANTDLRFEADTKSLQSIVAEIIYCGPTTTPPATVVSQQYRTSKLFVMYVPQTLASFAKSCDTASGKPAVVSVCLGACKFDLSTGYNSFHDERCQGCGLPTLFKELRKKDRDLWLAELSWGQRHTKGSGSTR